MTAEYKVEVWGTHRNAGFDDCVTGADCDTLAEAEEWFEKFQKAQWLSTCCHFVILNSDGQLLKEAAKPWKGTPQDPAMDDDAEDRAEFARMQGMAHGVDAYNEAMGWDVETQEDEPGMRPRF